MVVLDKFHRLWQLHLTSAGIFLVSLDAQKG
jgi:hypothetical protein